MDSKRAEGEEEQQQQQQEEEGPPRPPEGLDGAEEEADVGPAPPKAKKRKVRSACVQWGMMGSWVLVCA